MRSGFALLLISTLTLGACAEVVIEPDDDEPSTTSSTTTGSRPTCDPDASACDQELTCDPGFADCNGIAEDGCEAELESDPDHCGGCAQSCGQWGDCFQSTCMEILSTAQAALVGADALVLEWGAIYWSTPGLDLVGEIASVPAAGGATTPLVTGLEFPERLHSNGEWLVWSDVVSPGVYRMQLPQGPAEVVLQGPAHVLEVDDANVYFTTGTDIQSVPLGGGAATLLASGFVAVGAGRLLGSALYFTDLGPELIAPDSGLSISTHPEGALRRLELGSGQVDTLAVGLDTPVAVTIANDGLYWAEAGSLTTYVNGDAGINLGSLGRIVRASLDGSSPLVLASDLVRPVALEADAGHVYWASSGTVGGVHPEEIAYVSDGSVMRVALGGGSPETVVPAIDARNLVLSEDAVFFSTWNYGFIARKTKP